MLAQTLCLLLAASVAGAPAPPEKKVSAEAVEKVSVFPYPVHVETLDNGLRVLVVPMKAGGLASVRIGVRTGSRDEYEKGHTGFAHFFEHMMFRGTEKYPQEKYAEIVTRMGADTNAYTSSDLTVYQLDIAAEDLETVMDIESDRFQNLKYSEAVFKTEAGAVYGEYRKNKASPWYVMAEKVHQTAFKKHTYRHLTIGFEEDIAKMPSRFEYSKKFFKRYYRPENAFLIVAGDVDVDRTVALAREYFGPWKKGYVAPRVKKEPRQRKERRVEVTYPGRTLPTVNVAYKGDALDPKDRTYVASLLLADLAFGQTSAIRKKLLLEEQVVQRIGASGAMNRDPGLWSISASVKDPARVDYVLGEIDKTVEHFQTTLVAQEDLDAARARQKYSFLMGLDSPAAVAGRLARMVTVSGSPDVYDDLYRTMDMLTPQDIQDAAKQYLVEKQRTVGVMLSEADRKAADKKGDK